MIDRVSGNKVRNKIMYYFLLGNMVVQVNTVQL